MRGRCLVLGATGRLGRWLVPALAPAWEVWGTSRTGTAAPGATMVAYAADVDEGALAALVARAAPDVVVNTLRGEAAGTWLVNAVVPHQLAAVSQAPVVHVSTNAVFRPDPAAPLRPFGVGDAPAPDPAFGEYGYSKLLGEIPARQCVVRTTFADDTARLGAYRRVWNGASTLTVARFLAHLCGAGAPAGLHHLCSRPEDTAELAAAFAAVTGGQLPESPPTAQRGALLDGHTVADSLLAQFLELHAARTQGPHPVAPPVRSDPP